MAQTITLVTHARIPLKVDSALTQPLLRLQIRPLELPLIPSLLSTLHSYQPHPLLHLHSDVNLLIVCDHAFKEEKQRRGGAYGGEETTNR